MVVHVVAVPVILVVQLPFVCKAVVMFDFNNRRHLLPMHNRRLPSGGYSHLPRPVPLLRPADPDSHSCPGDERHPTGHTGLRGHPYAFALRKSTPHSTQGALASPSLLPWGLVQCSRYTDRSCVGERRQRWVLQSYEAYLSRVLLSKIFSSFI